MEIISQIIGFIAAFILFRFAFKYFAKEKYPTGLYIATIGAFILLCSFPWFQGFAKTWIISNVNSKLAELGQQVNTVQAATTEMHGQLAKHQTQIDEHQKELDDVQIKIRNAQSDVAKQQVNIGQQYQQISTVQNDLALAQTNIDTQEKKIEDVEFLVDNLFSKTVIDNVSVSNTNRVIKLYQTNDYCAVAIKLQFVPVHGSLQMTINEKMQQQVEDLITPYKNVVLEGLHGLDVNSTSISIKYVKDTRETNLVNSVEYRDNNVFADGVLILMGVR
jgi:hypothetical protein